jgi:hypothetical protein
MEKMLTLLFNNYHYFYLTTKANSRRKECKGKQIWIGCHPDEYKLAGSGVRVLREVWKSDILFQISLYLVFSYIVGW